MTIVKIDTSPDASVTLESLVMVAPRYVPLTLIGNHWEQDLPSANYHFADHIEGSDGASCGIVVTVGTATITHDKANHVVSAPPGQPGDDIYQFAAVVP